MKIRDEIILLVQAAAHRPVSVTAGANLCRDLGLSSLDFVNLLLGIEERYSIRFDLMEMVVCLRLDQLTSLVERKVKERESHA